MMGIDSSEERGASECGRIASPQRDKDAEFSGPSSKPQYGDRGR